MTVSDLLEQPCNKSDNVIKPATSCQQPDPNLLQQLGTSSANTICRQLVNRFVTTCLQTCNNLCVLTREAEKYKQKFKQTIQLFRKI
jgi:hypothetical protein